MSSLNTENNSELENPLKERIKLLMTENELEKPYSFATRVGLSKGTFTGIWREGRSSLHHGTVNKICAATGANPAWLVTGIGEPFKLNESEQHQDDYSQQPKNIIEEGLKISTQIDRDKLQQAFETTEKALQDQNKMMQPEAKSEFIVMLYIALIDTSAQPFDNQLLTTAIFNIENELKKARRTMSPDKKTLLIIAIYTLYIDDAFNKKAIEQTTIQLVRSAA